LRIAGAEESFHKWTNSANDWIGVVRQQTQKKASWRFTLVLNHAIPTFEDFAWSELEELVPEDPLGDRLQVDGERLTMVPP